MSSSCRAERAQKASRKGGKVKKGGTPRDVPGLKKVRPSPWRRPGHASITLDAQSLRFFHLTLYKIDQRLLSLNRRVEYG